MDFSPVLFGCYDLSHFNTQHQYIVYLVDIPSPFLEMLVQEFFLFSHGFLVNLKQQIAEWLEHEFGFFWPAKLVHIAVGKQVKKIVLFVFDGLEAKCPRLAHRVNAYWHPVWFVVGYFFVAEQEHRGICAGIFNFVVNLVNDNDGHVHAVF